MRRILVALAGLAALVPAGCGNDVTRPPDVRTPEPPRGAREVTLEPGGIRFRAPGNWRTLAPEGSRVGGVRSNTATVAVWRYVRSEPLPDTPEELKAVQELLLERVRARDPRFELRSADRRRRGGALAVEVVGRQHAGGRPYGVRSAHVFHAGAEIVVDAYAPRRHFDRLDRTVFRPLLDSLELPG